MKVAIIHPWFWSLGGGEKVIEALASLYPQAEIFLLGCRKQGIPATLRNRKIHTSFMNDIPGISKLRWPLFFLYPTAVESFDLREYDLVISSSGPATFGVNIRQDATHICYCHSPGRSFWDSYAERQNSLGPLGKLIYTGLATYVRTWEFSAAQRVDRFVANSHYISRRIQKYLRRDSTVVYPPVNTSIGYLQDQHDNYYLSVGRLEGKKRLDLVIAACNKTQRRLIIAGEGPEEKNLKGISGPTVEFTGRVADADLPALYANCRAFLFAADEDFGIAPVEAQSFGRPVIAYSHGGALETVRVNDANGRSDTGVFFPEQSVDSLIDGIRRFETLEAQFVPAEIQEHTRQFDTSAFKKNFLSMADHAMRGE
jgi:glycosyltransferase involved in cell wall biosynthesis